MSENPLTQKANYGTEPVNNTMMGFNTNFSTEIPFLTRMANKITTVKSNTPSQLSIRGEVAALRARNPRNTQLQGETNVYIDDFEGTQNVGLSVYDIDELKSAMGLIHPSLIQFPLNPFDQRFLSSGILKELHLAGIDTYARSIFMQGILISKKIRNAQYFQQWNNELNAWRDFCAKNNLLPYEACIKFITDCNFLTGYTFGVSSLKELLQISAAIKLDAAVDCTNFASCDLNLIDPRQWP